MKRHSWPHSFPGISAALLAIAALLASSIGVHAATARHVTQGPGPTRGGTVTVAFPGDMTSFDPAQAYSDDWQVLNGTLFDGLYQFDKTGTPQLDLAAGPPAISADRKVWTFTLRKGVQFSNGQELTADDLAFSIVRTLDPHLKPAVSWGQTSEAPFTGAADFIAGKTHSVPGIQVLGRYSIRFSLDQPVAIFPYILAETFNMAVPKSVVTKESPDYFASHPIGTGPFALQSWQKGSKLVFVRNRHYFKAASGKPYLDGITVLVNVPVNVITLRIQRGEVQGLGDASQVSSADVQQLSADPTYASYVVDAPTTFVNWLDLDVHQPPLDKPAIRQAIALAINRKKLVKLLGGLAAPAYQIFIPLMAQHDPALDQHPLYPYDPARASALVKSSGYSGQPITLLYANNFPGQTAMAPGIQQDLKQIGLNVTLRGVTHDTLIKLREPLKGHYINFGLWGIDFPDGYDVYTGDMACGDNVEGATSGSHYCDTGADALVNKAEALALGPDRNALIRQAQARILRSASIVPLVFPRNVDIVSPKVGGFYYSPIFGWQFENYWLKK